MWDYTKFTIDVIEETRIALKGRDTTKLIEIHDRLKLSGIQYCCVGNERLGELYEWFDFFLKRKESE